MRFLEPPKFVLHAKKISDLKNCRKRLGQVNERSTKLTLPDFDGVDFFCETLIKNHDKPVPREAINRATKTLERVCSDVMAPIEPASIFGFRYVITFIDDYAKYSAVKMMTFKSEALEKVKGYVA